MVDHLSAYAALVTQEVTTAGTDVLARAVAWMFGGLCALLFIGLAGTAVMLGVLQSRFHWVLVVVPAIALLLALVAMLSARRPTASAHFLELKSQLAADTGLLRSTGGSHAR